MRAATPKFKLLIPQISVEPNTSEHIDRAVQALSVEEQQISRLSFGSVSSFGATEDRTIHGLWKPFETDPTRPVGAVEVLIQPIAGSESPLLFVGPYTIIAGRDYIVGGSLAATATNIATAITNIPGYDAVPAAETVTVQGPVGGTDLKFSVRYQAIDANFDFTYTGSFEELGYITGPIFPVELA